MANETQVGKATGSTNSKSETAKKMQAGRALFNAAKGKLSREERMGFDLCNSAEKLVNLAKDRVLHGKPVPPEFMRALGQLQAAGGEMLFD